MTRKEAVYGAEQKLAAAGIADAKLDARYLFYHVTGLNQMELLLYGEKEVLEAEQRAYDELVSQRAGHMPLQYLTGVQEFMGLEFQVNSNVLIPRQDTECLVEEVLKYSTGKRVLDVCTGSGCIIISLAKLGSLSGAFACDLSEKALEVARSNADQLDARIEFFQGDLFAPISGTYDIIVSNPPYICSDALEGLMPEVRCYEPRMALDGMADGLAFYRGITAEAGSYLAEDGMLFFEIGFDQAEPVAALMRQNGFDKIQIRKDYAGLDRVVFGYRKKGN